MALQVNGATVNRHHAASRVGRRMGELDDNVGAPRLAHDHGSIEFERFDEKCEVVRDGLHVEAAVGLRTAAVPALIDGHHGMSAAHQLHRDAIPQARVRSKAVHQHERRLVEMIVVAPRHAMQVDFLSDSVELAALHGRRVSHGIGRMARW